MSTGVEIIPIFIYLAAAAGAKYGLDTLVHSAATLGDKLAEKQYPHEPTIKFGPNISLHYDEHATRQPPGGGDMMDESVNTEELCGNFQRDLASVTMPTVMNDEDLLLGALLDYGIDHTNEDGVIKAAREEVRLVFEIGENGAYESKITGAQNQEEAQKICCEIMELYLQRAQQRAYDNIKSRAGHNGLALESEEIAEDNSIVLTFVVRRQGS